MGQIPIDRGKGDARALERAIEELRKGACIGIFLEGTRSLGRSCARGAASDGWPRRCPRRQIVACTVTGTTDIPRFPKRPHVKVRFFRPAALDEGIPRRELPVPLLEEIRSTAPIERGGQAQEGRRAPPRGRGAEGTAPTA